MAYAAAVYLREAHPEAVVAFGIGERAMQEEFAAAGILLLFAPQQQQLEQASSAVRGPGETPSAREGYADSAAQQQQLQQQQQKQQVAAAAAAGAVAVDELDPRVGAVVVGWDRSFNYHKMALACFYLQQQKQRQHQKQQQGNDEKEEFLPFIATNRDPYNCVDGIRHPANGAQLAAIEAVVGRRAECIGKESPWLAKWLPTHLQLDLNRTLVVGDRLDTDMLFAANIGAASLLVLTGCATPNDLKAVSPNHPQAPNYVLPHLGQLAGALQQALTPS